MRTSFLLPSSFKKPGWIIFITGLLGGFYWLLIDSEPQWSEVNVLIIYLDEIFNRPQWFTILKNPLFDEVVSILIIIGGIMVAFSREKIEDEYVAKIRLESLVWAVYFNYLVLLMTITLVYGITFFYVLVFNMFTLLFFFIIRFRWLMWKNNQNSEL